MTKSASLGQNFLHDARAARRIVDLLEAPAGPILEIGAGHGMLSGPLLEKFPGRRVVLVEVDPRLAAELERRFAESAEILAGDILGIELGQVFAGESAAVIGNLPYHISKPLVDWLIAQRRWIGEAVLMLQRDFVDKLLSKAGGRKYNAQSVVFQLLFRARRCFDVPAGAFAPAPKVRSTVIAARPADPPPREPAGPFYDFVKLCFTGRRKTLWNALSPRYPRDRLAAAGLAANTRAERLSPRRFAELFDALQPPAALPPS